MPPFYFIRHGQTDWNKQRLVQGQTDVPLNAVGLSQARVAKELLATMSIATVCTSPLGRARRTAEIVNEALKCPMVEIDGLQECHFGELEGKPVTGDTFLDLVADAQNWGGETLETFTDRVVAAVEHALSHPGPVLVVAHGGAYKAMHNYFGLQSYHDIANAAPVYLTPPVHGEGRWSVNPVG